MSSSNEQDANSSPNPITTTTTNLQCSEGESEREPPLTATSSPEKHPTNPHSPSPLQFQTGGTGHYPFFGGTSLGISNSGGGGGGTYSTTTTEPATPTSLHSEYSESATTFRSSSDNISNSGPFSPSVLASSGKRFWNEGSSWLINRIAYSQSSSSAYSSMDKGSSAYGRCCE
ncbi:unnamed protein product [Orchesella dallaii]|uniref:Uncharacterized protein n=1 Tax=Orchesella dallaii TaxID=48710 RepID=A0ABP1PSS0_9HEXA